MQQQQSQLQPLFSYNKPGANMFQISVVRQLGNESQFQKNIFCFLTSVPGSIAQGGGRTFNYQNKITMKVDYDKILTLGKAIKAYASGKEASFGPFTIYVDTSKSQYGGSGGGKSMLLQKGVDNKHNTPVVNMFFKTQTSQAIVISLSIAEALALSDICEWIAKKCFELDFDLSSGGFQTKAFPNQVAQPKKVPTQTQYQMPNYDNAKIQLTNQPDNAVNNVVSNFANGLQNVSSPSDDFFEDSPF